MRGFSKVRKLDSTYSRINQTEKPISIMTDIESRCRKTENPSFKYTHRSEYKCLCVRVPVVPEFKVTPFVKAQCGAMLLVVTTFLDSD